MPYIGCSAMPKSYDGAMDLIENHGMLGTKAIDRKTRLVHLGDSVILELYECPIYRFWMGGWDSFYVPAKWNTRTTRARINACLPSFLRLHMVKGKLALSSPDDTLYVPVGEWVDLPDTVIEGEAPITKIKWMKPPKKSAPKGALVLSL